MRRLAEARTPIVRRLGQGRAGTVGGGRFLANPSVTTRDTFAAAGRQCERKLAGGGLLFSIAEGWTVADRRTLETPEGRTERQKSPHEQGSLAWLAWIVARLGGWSGYQRYGPPGPKTMAIGWQTVTSMYQGWRLR